MCHLVEEQQPGREANWGHVTEERHLMPEEPLPYRVYQVCCVVVLCIYYLDSLFLYFPSFSYEWSAVEAAQGGIAGGDPVVNTATSPSLQAAPEEAGAEGITGKAGKQIETRPLASAPGTFGTFLPPFLFHMVAAEEHQRGSGEKSFSLRNLLPRFCGGKNSYRKKKKKEPKLSKSLKMQKYCISETSETSAPPIR